MYDQFIPEMHLKQPGITYSACGPLTKNQERIQKFKETGDTNYIYKTELDKACFQHDMEILKISKKRKYDRYQRGLASMEYKFFGKKWTGSGVAKLSNKFAIDNKKIK